MNAVEIEEALSNLAQEAFDPNEFPFQFLEAFGNKATTIKRLRVAAGKKGSSNASDIEGAYLQRNNIHIKVCEAGTATATLRALKASSATTKAKAKFILVTDGQELQAEDVNSGDTIACDFARFPDHFGFFLPLAGITTVESIRNNPIDIKATSRLNRLYVELLKQNEDWTTDERRHEMNQFMARLIFCFFAEDTNIFQSSNLFTATIEQMSDSKSASHASGSVEHVLGELFRAMDIHPDNRSTADLPRWADLFPYVNGGLFAGSCNIPKFSNIARAYLIHAGNLDWQAINPDIFGSMIQAVADDEERGDLGMHYTSVPNILKVLNPLFLDELREQLEQASDNPRKLLNLRKRIAEIKVFDPACGSGNFLVIAYIQLREIEAEVIERRNDEQKSCIKLANFYGIDVKDFSVEVARLSLLIAEFQSDVRLIGQKEAKALVLPLKNSGNFLSANALGTNWIDFCPPVNSEVYICGNPPYQGYSDRTIEQKNDMQKLSKQFHIGMRLDYIGCWFVKASEYLKLYPAKFAFVSTNSICQGEQASLLWPLILSNNQEIFFARQSFNWTNNAVKNAGVTCVIVGVDRKGNPRKRIFSEHIAKNVSSISPYLVEGASIVMTQRKSSISALPAVSLGSSAIDGGHLILDPSEARQILIQHPSSSKFIKPFIGGSDLLKGIRRFCIWVEDGDIDEAMQVPPIAGRIDNCKKYRQTAGRDAKKAANVPHRFFYRKHKNVRSIVAPMTSSGKRDFLPVSVIEKGNIISNGALVSYHQDLYVFGILSSRLHTVWLSVTSARMRTDFRYSVNLTYNNLALPTLTEKNKTDLTHCAEDILLAREAHFPATIADLYDPKKMPENLRAAHERNDEVLERIFIGRRFKNDTERLEKLFALYTKIIAEEQTDKTTRAKTKPAKKVQ